MHDDIALLREAVALLDLSGEPLERARAHADLGAALRRAGRPIEAREPLRVAVDLAHRFGAPALEEHALAELRAAGARPRRRAVTGPGALTRSERRIAELAAGGRLNREIAEALVVTLATVEYHLRNTYRKLGISSRKQLAQALAVPRSDAAATVQIRIARGSAAVGHFMLAADAYTASLSAGLPLAALRWRSLPTRDAAFSRWAGHSASATWTLDR
jgi:DNA-binding CsgD family transcriptional regulator